MPVQIQEVDKELETEEAEVTDEQISESDKAIKSSMILSPMRTARENANKVQKQEDEQKALDRI